MNKSLVISNWDRAYSQGKYDNEGPIGLVQDIVHTLKQHKIAKEHGFYAGCGNGRNFIPLLDAGLNVAGNDISPVAIKQLQKLRPVPTSLQVIS